MDKQAEPDVAVLKKALGKTYKTWQSVVAFTLKANNEATGVWNFAGAKFGWSFRIKDKKRVIVYMLPCDGFFIASFVFGTMATDEILGSDISDAIKAEARNATVYAEGRGIRISVPDDSYINDLKKLISIKINNR